MIRRSQKLYERHSFLKIVLKIVISHRRRDCSVGLLYEWVWIDVLARVFLIRVQEDMCSRKAVICSNRNTCSKRDFKSFVHFSKACVFNVISYEASE